MAALVVTSNVQLSIAVTIAVTFVIVVNAL